MSADERLHALGREMLRHAKGCGPTRRFIGDSLDDLPYARPVAHSLPVVEKLLRTDLKTHPTTLPLTRAIYTAAHDLHWAQSYTEAQVGARHLANYGWFNLGPS